MGAQPSAGTTLSIGTTATTASSDSYTLIGSLSAVPEYGVKYDNVRFEDLGLAEYLDNTGAKNPSSMSVSVGRDLADAGQVAVKAANGVNSYYNFKLVHPDGTIDYFKAKVQGFATAPGGLTANTMAAVTLQPKASSFSENNAGSAPANSVLPAISGLLANGSVLTAYPGTWTQPATFTYQWKKDTVNIGGATNATYTTVGGDATHSITVVVTATNAVGSASATSAGVIIA